MAAGKTTLGRAVAEAAAIPFFDLDAEVERMAGMPVGDIFARLGEQAFRDMEARTLERVAASCGRVVVACGGGTPCRPASMDLMLRAGTVVWLQADENRVLRRLREAPGQRPRIDAVADSSLAAFVRAEGARRAPFYSRAPHTFDSTRLDTPAEVADTVRLFVQTFLNHP